MNNTPEVTTKEITEADIVGFLLKHADRIAEKYGAILCTVDVSVGRHSTGSVYTKWKSYVSQETDTVAPGFSKEFPTVDEAVASALSFNSEESRRAKAAQMRADAADMLAKADRLEAQA